MVGYGGTFLFGRIDIFQMNFITFTIKDLLQRKVGLAISVLGISLGVCVCIIMLGLADTIRASFHDLYKRRQTDIILTQSDQFSLFTSELDYSTYNTLLEFDEIEDIAPVLIAIVKIKGKHVPIFGWERNSFLFDNMKFNQGEKFEPEGGGILIGDMVFENVGYAFNEMLEIKKKAFNISGVFTSSNPFERGVMIMPLEALQDLAKKKNKISLFNLRVKPEHRNPQQLELLSEKIKARLPEVDAQRSDIFIKENMRNIMVGEKLSLLITLITIIAVTLGLANIMLTNVLEKSRFLSVLFTIGWKKSEVILFFFLECALLAFVGGALGIILGVRGLAYLFQMTQFSILSPTFSQVFLVQIISVILMIALFSVVGPAIIIINHNPITVIENE